MTTTTIRPTKAEQRAATRARILDAAVTCLVELGHARTTTLVVQERAGVSRGALLHYFPTRAELLAETVNHLFEMQISERESMSLRVGGRIEQAVRLLWAMSTSTLSIAALELWTAARTDTELRSALVKHEAYLNAEVRLIRHYLHGIGFERRAGQPQVEVFADAH